jgi:hypothetical protein
MRDDDIIAAGRTIAEDLPRLLGDAAPPVAAALRDLLAQADAGRPDLADEILDLLSADPITRQELARRLVGDADTLRG